MYSAIIKTPIGNLAVICQGKKKLSVASIQYLPAKTVPKMPSDPLEKKLVLALQKDLEKYWQNPKHKFTVPLAPEGTDLQKRVWKALQQIPSGKTVTYGELALKIGTGARVIGNACRKNPILILIPCHRVVAKTGLGGFGGDTSGKLIDNKKYLLKHENCLL
ncbi:MAG: methylated-DNA--[protein]-cysteine S-methyltransferase [Gammaproteobacteria bacterium]